MLPYKTALPSVLAPDKSCFCLSAPESLPSSRQISSGSFAETWVNTRRRNPKKSPSRIPIFSITFISISKDRLAQMIHGRRKNDETVSIEGRAWRREGTETNSFNVLFGARPSHFSQVFAPETQFAGHSKAQAHCLR